MGHPIYPARAPNPIEQGAASVTSFEEALELEYTFCVNPNMQPALVAAEPRLAPLVVPQSLGSSLDAMDAGTCMAALIHDDYVRGQPLE